MRGKHLYFIVLFIVIFINPYFTFSQIGGGTTITVDPNKTAEELVEELLGDGFVYDDNVWGATLIGTGIANGFFDGTNCNIGMQSGIIFSSGASEGAESPFSLNSTSPSSGSNGGGSDADLTAIINGTGTNDASGIIFNFRPESDTVKFQYVFGSEEYPEYNNGPFNDVFAFFLSGPNPSGGNYNKENIALIPGTSTAITIETVNSDVNSEYYIDNQGGFGAPLSVEYDGFTTVLTAWALVTPCEDYEIKIAIADAQDKAWDSGVFLKSNSFTAAQVEVVQEYANSDISNSVEGCNDVSLSFNIDARSQDTDIDFTITQGSGYATYGVDYTTIPVVDPNNGLITIPAGQTSATIEIHPIEDGIIEGVETFELLYTHDLGCTTDDDVITVLIEDHMDVDITPYGDVDIDCGESTSLWVEVRDGYPGYSYTWNTGQGDVDSINVSPTSNTDYTISVNDQCGFNSSYTFPVTVDQPAPVISGVQTTCAGDTITLYASGGVSYLWNDNSTADSLVISPETTTNYTVTITSALGCQADTTVTVPVNPLPYVYLNSFPFACEDNTAFLLDQGSPLGGSYAGTDVYKSGTEFYFNAQNTSPGDSVEVYYTVFNASGCINTDTSYVKVAALPDVSFHPADNNFCIDEGLITLNDGLPSGGYYYCLLYTSPSPRDS